MQNQKGKHISTPNNKQAGGFTPGPLYARGRYIFKDYGDQCYTIAEIWLHEEADADAKLYAAAPELITERQQISDELGRMEWTTPHEAERLLKDFIEQFHYSEAVAKATGSARLDKAVEAMAEGRAS